MPYYILIARNDEGEINSVVVTGSEKQAREWEGEVLVTPNLYIDLSI